MTFVEFAIVAILLLNIFFTIFNGIMAVKNNELLSDIRDSMNRNSMPVSE